MHVTILQGIKCTNESMPLQVTLQFIPCDPVGRQFPRPESLLRRVSAVALVTMATAYNSTVPFTHKQHRHTRQLLLSLTLTISFTLLLSQKHHPH